MRLVGILFLVLNLSTLVGCDNKKLESEPTKKETLKADGSSLTTSQQQDDPKAIKERPTISPPVNCQKFTEGELSEAENKTMAYVDRGVAGYHRILDGISSYLLDLISYNKQPTRDFLAFNTLLTLIEDDKNYQKQVKEFYNAQSQLKAKIEQSDQILAEKIYCLAEKYVGDVNRSKDKNYMELAKDLEKTCVEKITSLEKNKAGKTALPHCRNEYMKVYLTLKGMSK